MPIIKAPSIDVENLASKLPESFQWPVGALLGGLKYLSGGDDPAGSAVAATSGAPLMAAEGPALRGLSGLIKPSIGQGNGPHPAIRALMDALGGQPEAYDPLTVFSQEKLGGYQVPHRSMITAPAGFELPAETSAYPARDPNLINTFTQRRDNGLGRAADYTKYGGYPKAPKGTPAVKADFSK